MPAVLSLILVVRTLLHHWIEASEEVADAGCQQPDHQHDADDDPQQNLAHCHLSVACGSKGGWMQGPCRRACMLGSPG